MINLPFNELKKKNLGEINKFFINFLLIYLVFYQTAKSFVCHFSEYLVGKMYGSFLWLLDNELHCLMFHKIYNIQTL